MTKLRCSLFCRKLGNDVYMDPCLHDMYVVLIVVHTTINLSFGVALIWCLVLSIVVFMTCDASLSGI